KKLIVDIRTTADGRATHGEYRVILPDGEVRWVEIRRFVIFDEETNQPTRFIGAARDITRRKESETHQLDLRLEREKNEITRRFLSQVAHDFRTPLAIVKTSAYLVEKSPDPEKRSYHLEKLNMQIAHIQKLLEDIFALSRLDLKADHFEFRRFNLNSLVTEL